MSSPTGWNHTSPVGDATAPRNPTFDGWRSVGDVRTVVGMGDTAIIVTSTARPGRRDEIRAIYDEMMVPRAEANDTQEVVVWCDDLHDADTFYLFEIYRDAASMGANAQAPWFADYLARVGPLMADEPKVRLATPRWSKGLATV